MKYIFSVLFALAVFCGASSYAHADNFHATVLDPSCNSTTMPTECGIGFTDLGTSIPVALSAAQCGSGAIQPPITGLPADTTTYGCFLGSNDTGSTITSITLHFASILDVTGCDTTLEGLNHGPAFANNSCAVDPMGGFDLSFSGGPGVPDGNDFVILEEGVNPADFTGAAVISDTPEPDSLLLLSTGMLMMGLYFAGRQRLFSFLKK